MVFFSIVVASSKKCDSFFFVDRIDNICGFYWTDALQFRIYGVFRVTPNQNLSSRLSGSFPCPRDNDDQGPLFTKTEMLILS